MKITLGSQVADSITGFAGTVVSRTEYLNGCVRLGVQSHKLHDGRPIDVDHFDEVQLRVKKLAKVPAAIPGGGPHPAPKRAADPARR